MLEATRIFLFSLGLGISSLACAGGPVSWMFSSAASGPDSLVVRLSSTCEPGWHLYALSLPNDEGPLPTVVRLLPSTDYRAAGPVMEPAPEEKDDPNFGMRVRFHSGTATFTQPVVRENKEAFALHGSVEYMACNDKTCLPPTQVEFTLDIPPAP